MKARYIKDFQTILQVFTRISASRLLGATFNPKLAYQVGAVVAREARAKGFNVLLGGGMNLMRDPRNGRNFEYLSEDPLLSGLLGGQYVAGAQAQGVVCTLKHFSLNSNETNRHFWNAMIDPAAHRESDLLAFQIAIEQGQPHAIMGAYNKVNGSYACGNGVLLNNVLKKAWGYKGWVMSDWGAVKSWEYANEGLDQQQGEQLDQQVWFDAPLRQALAEGKFERSRLSDMVRRILRSMHSAGLVNAISNPALDMDAHAAATLLTARQGIVLVKNEGVLPLSSTVKSIAVIGGRAHIGVPNGGGSSDVTPIGGYAAQIPLGGWSEMAAMLTENYFPSSPLQELEKLLPGVSISYDPGMYQEGAAAFAARHEMTI